MNTIEKNGKQLAVYGFFLALQGDEIVVECTYNTTNRASVTKVG